MKNAIDEMPTMLELNEKNFPALKNWKVGTKVSLEVEAEVMNIGKSMYEQSPKLRCSLKVTKISLDKEDEPMSQSERQARKGHY